MTGPELDGLPEEVALLTEVRQLYATTRANPRVIRLAVRMRDMVDERPLRRAVNCAMQRYPYLCVELAQRDGQPVFLRNRREVVVFHAPSPHTLASAESNFHLLSFSWWDNWIWVDVFHGLTDGTGAYELARTLLWYYCEARYGVRLEGERIRLLGDVLSPAEWEDPVLKMHDLPEPRKAVPQEAAFDLMDDGGLGPREAARVFAVAIPEAEFMRFNIAHDGSPATMVSLLLCRAIDHTWPSRTKPLRVLLCANQRPALGAPRARHNLVGMVTLEYKDRMRGWPIERQSTIFRGMTLAQTLEGTVLEGVARQKQVAERLLAMTSDAERTAFCASLEPLGRQTATATVSYVGKANFQGAEPYIRDMRLTTGQTMPLLVEISAVNGVFKLDLMQTFSSDSLVRAFLRELEHEGITYDLQDVRPVQLSAAEFPWV